ncbi:MAG TPA: amidase [Caulobacteraceae bacterium]|jgi:aspartyl-tRNA(Asn)/glutamyl-tRNA(Gln) amidotransferase subunit A
MKVKGSTLAELAAGLENGQTTSRALVEDALEAIEVDPRAFTRIDVAGARAAADAADRSRREGRAASPLAGIPVSIKDLFDVAGQPTPAGSAILANAPPATADAPAVARLKAAGLVVVGRTQMSEFAFTGLGLNPHTPQPVNPIDPARVPGGSSGGAAVSVALGQAAGALGTDTGGSVRIPAAFCGLAGFKPTQRRVSRAGAFPLSTTLDSIGPIARTAACCAALDAIIADVPPAPHPPVTLAGLRLCTADHYFLAGMDAAVGHAFEAALAAISDAGASVEPISLPPLARIPAMNARGSISNAESFALHRRLGLLDERDRYDPYVLARIELAKAMPAADYLDLLAERDRLISEIELVLAPYDALLTPTSPILAPRFADIAEPAEFARLNGLVLRNPMVVNILDRCAISLPLAAAPGAGLMVIGAPMTDTRLLALARALETSLRS